MPDTTLAQALEDSVPLADELLALAARLGARLEEDPFGNPVLLVALAIERRMDDGTLSEEAIGGLIRHLRDAGFADRARRLAHYVGGAEPAENDRVLADLAQHLLRPDPEDSPVRLAEYRALVERTRFAAVFTAHPTFALPPEVGHALAEMASGRPAAAFASHRPPAITLGQEFIEAVAAISNGRDAIDRFNAALLSVARTAWPDRWTSLVPCPIVLASWVGYDTDGRTDIGWWETIRLRLEMKRLQLQRLHAELAVLAPAAPIAARLEAALAAVAAQIDSCPDAPDPTRVAAFAHALVDHREAALTSPAPLLPLFDAALAASEDDHTRLAL
ncbi:MAG TPA: phosphoenolpyruvate carboxylase, partial [Acetobacteraceae bacterium]|nr:phosphoenolpyruvate carboxylase [Acetobacteraceae bacterium]